MLRRRAPGSLALAAALAFHALACDRPGAGGALSGQPGRTPASATPPRAPDRSGADADIASPSADAAAPAAPAAPTPTGPPPLAAPGPLVALPVADGQHPDAVVSVPLGATTPRPIVIATHGNYDRPEWQCQVWRQIVGEDVFILCPRGVSRPDSPSRDDVRFTYPTNQRLEQELEAGLAALRARFPEHVDSGPPLYTGFSLGAIMGVAIASRKPALFPRLVLVEGGHDRWTDAAASAFARGGGARVLFVCAQAGCAADARRAAARLERAGVAAKVVRSKDVGHTYDGAVAEETRRALPWVLEGDARFAASASAAPAQGNGSPGQAKAP